MSAASAQRTFSPAQVGGIALVVVLLVANAALAIFNTLHLAEDGRLVAHTHVVLGALDDVQLSVTEAETSQRGFMLTTDETFLGPYESARARTGTQLADLAALVDDNALQLERVGELKKRIDARLARMAEVIELRRKMTVEEITKRVMPPKGVELMEAVRAQVAEMKNVETALLAQREGERARMLETAIRTGAVGGLAGLGLVIALVLTLRRELRDRARAAHDIRAQRELLHITLESIGDAVISTDAQGRVTFLNAVAMQLTGWNESDARGHALDEVFHIIGEDDRKPGANPALRALREGTIVGLSNHTLLIARDGTERAIDDSAAPIRDEEGGVVGVVLVFRDVTAERELQRALRMSEARKTAMLERALDCIVTIDHHGRILEFNPAAEETFGWKRADVLNRDVADLIIPHDMRARHRAGLVQFLSTGKGPILDQRLELAGLRADGTTIPLEVAVTAIQREGPPVFTAWLRDITRRKKDADELSERMRLLSLGADVGRALTQADTLDGLLRRCAGALVEHLHGAHARVWTWNADEEVLELAASAGVEAPVDPSHRRVRLGQGLLGRIAKERKPHFTNRAQEDPNVPRPALPPSAQIVAFAGYPLLVEDRLVGVVKLFACQALSETTLTSIASVATQIALGIERKRSEEHVTRLLASERTRSERLVQVAAASSTLNSAQTRSSVIGVLGAEARRILGARRAHVASDVVAPPEDSRTLVVQLFGRGGRAVGHIEVTGDPDAKFSADDRAILTQLAHMGAIALDNARLYEELRENDRRKDEFLATLSHELRNPLAPIRNAVQVMKLSEDDAKAAQWGREIIERQVRQLARLVDDLLDLSRISRGKLELRRERVDLVALTRAAVETGRLLADVKGQDLRLEAPAAPIELDADPARITQVLQNLIHNASKYTPNGGVIRVSVEREDSVAVVRVRDNGVGISADMLPQVFDMFVQGDQGIERSAGGLGIGLTLVKTMVEMHGGRVSAHSAGPDQGAEFRVELPLPKPSAPAVTTPPPVPAVAKKVGRRVLVVDDNADSVASLQMMLRIMGHNVRVAHDGVEAVEVALAFEPELVLLDIGLPRLNGYDAAREIRKQPRGKESVIVAVTGWGQEEDRRRSSEAGFDRHIVKPVEPSAIEAILQMMEPSEGGTERESSDGPGQNPA